MDSLVHRLLSVVERTPDKIFAHLISVSGESSLSYAELLAESARYAAFYQEHGLRKGDVLLLMLRPGAASYQAFVGAMLAGMVPAFMPLPGPKQPPEVYWPIHRDVVARKDVKAVLTHADHAVEIEKYMPTSGLAVLHVEALDQSEYRSDVFREAVPLADDIAFIQHSSGTTGIKKGVCLSHGIVLRQIDAYAEQLGFDENACVASWLPLYHDMGLITSFLMPMVKGASVVACSPFEWLVNPGIWLQAASDLRCSYAWMPNFAFNHLSRVVQPEPTWDFSSLRWINCSEPCKANSFEQFRNHFSDVGVADRSFQVCYAMAENVFAVTQTRGGELLRSMGRHLDLSEDAEILVSESATDGLTETLSCGQAMPGVEIEIWDESGQPLPDGRVGEIVIRGEYLFSGYHAAPELTAQRFRNGWFLTHDLGFMDSGELFVTGRIDDLINLYGRKIYAHDIEFVVGSIAGVVPGRCVAIGQTSEETGSQELVVLAETIPDVELAALKREIKLEIEAKLGFTAGKVELFGKGWLLKTTSGKISRYLNHQKYIEMLDRMVPRSSTRTIST